MQLSGYSLENAEKITFYLFLALESKSLYLVKHYSECFYGDSLVINNVGQK